MKTTTTFILLGIIIIFLNLGCTNSDNNIINNESTQITKEITPEDLGQASFQAFKENNFNNITKYFTDKHDLVELCKNHYNNEISKENNEQAKLQKEQKLKQTLEEINQEGYYEKFIAKKEKRFNRDWEDAKRIGVVWENASLKEIKPSKEKTKDGNKYIDIAVTFSCSDKLFEFELEYCFFLTKGLVISEVDGVKKI